MHPRELAVPIEWTVNYAVSVDPLGIIRRLVIDGITSFRAVTGATRTADRELIGYFPTGDAAAVAVWQRYCRRSAEQHEAASTTHGSWERG